MYLRSLFTPGHFINAALCKALQVSKKISNVYFELFLIVLLDCIIECVCVCVFINTIVICFNILYTK
jgi:hypothetical protein